MRSLSPVVVLIAAFAVAADEPCKSGPAAGQKFGPYSFLIATGPNRGTSHCYVCETGAKPAVIVFAQKTSDGLGALLLDLDGLVARHKGAELGAWVTFLSDDQPALEPKIAEWGKKLGLRGVPLGIFEDSEGPPSYRLSRDAEVTVLLVKDGKVTNNFAFRPGELKSETARPILSAAQQLVK
jgi:hypothetical protein